MEVRFYVPPSQSDERQDPVEVRKRGPIPFLAVVLSPFFYLSGFFYRRC